MTSMGAETFLSTLNLKESFLRAATSKNETKLRKTEKHENNSNESDFSENEIPDLNA